MLICGAHLGDAGSILKIKIREKGKNGSCQCNLSIQPSTHSTLIKSQVTPSCYSKTLWNTKEKKSIEHSGHYF